MIVVNADCRMPTHNQIQKKRKTTCLKRMTNDQRGFFFSSIIFVEICNVLSFSFLHVFRFMHHPYEMKWLHSQRKSVNFSWKFGKFQIDWIFNSSINIWIKYLTCSFYRPAGCHILSVRKHVRFPASQPCRKNGMGAFIFCWNGKDFSLVFPLNLAIPIEFSWFLVIITVNWVKIMLENELILINLQ